MLEPGGRPELLAATGLDEVAPIERGTHDESWPELWQEMTVVRRSEPASVAW